MEERGQRQKCLHTFAQSCAFLWYKNKLTVPITYFSPKTCRANSHTQISVSAAMAPLRTLGAYT